MTFFSGNDEIWPFHFFSSLAIGVANVGGTLDYTQSGSGHGFHFVLGDPFATADDGAGVTHATPWGCCLPRNKANNRFLDVLPDELCRRFLGGAANFTDHDDRFGVFVFVEQLQRIDEMGSDNRVAPNSNAG